MTKGTLADRYFNWMYLIVAEGRPKKVSYNKLLQTLHDTEFQYSIALDANRADDGTNLRYRFGREFNLPDSMVASYLDCRPCSVLEMMIALAIRCEEHIMSDPEIGNRTGVWFWEMIQSLGLDGMDDAHFDKARVEKAVGMFLYRQYEKDGRGGLFTIKNPRRDMRTAEIWYQMYWYLNEYFAEKEEV